MRRFYRSEVDRMVTGVCAGLAKQINLDATIVRIIAVIGLIFAFPFTLITYFVLTILVPSEGDLES